MKQFVVHAVLVAPADVHALYARSGGSAAAWRPERDDEVFGKVMEQAANFKKCND